MRRALIGTAFAAAALSCAPATAGEVSQTGSSSSFTISIVIPPFAAALAAAQDGAAGLWTIDGSANENMVRLPAEMTGAESDAQVFHSPQTVLQVSLSPNPYVQMAGSSSAMLNGLKRSSLHLTRSLAFAAKENQPVVTMFVSTI